MDEQLVMAHGPAAAVEPAAEGGQGAYEQCHGSGTLEEAVREQDRQQHTFLDLAKSHDWASVREALTAEPSLVNVTPGGRWSALHQAGLSGNPGAVAMLLLFGADPTTRANDGGTLKTAREVAASDEVQLLLSAAEQRQAAAGKTQQEVELHQIDPHSDAVDELLCAACAPTPPGPFPPSTGGLAAELEPETEPESLAQLMTLLEGSGHLPHQLEATKGMLQQMGEDTSAIDAVIATVTARIARAEAAQGGPVTEQTVPNYLIPIGDVKVGPRIGRGALGEVLLGEYESTRVALKGLHMLRTDEASQAEWGGALSAAERTHLLDQFKRECDTMRGLVHENILPFVGVVVDNTPVAEPLYLATQFIESGTLHDVLHAAKYAVMRSDGGCIPLETQLTVFVGMFAGLAFLAEKRLIHRDIKPANILAVVDGSRLTKVLLADFGESKQLTATMTRVAGTAAGTPLYMAPEMGQEEDAKGSKADVFSAGVVLIETNTGQLPNPGPTKRKEGRRRVDIPEKERRAADLAAVRHPEVWELASRCIVDFDGERADAAEMLERCLALGGQDAPVRSSSIFMVNISSQERIQLDVTAATTVADLKRQAVATMDLPHGSAVGLIFCGRKMEDQRTVDDYNLLDGTVVYLDFDLDLEP